MSSPQLRSQCFEVVNLDDETVPATGLRLLTVGHWSRCGRLRPGQPKAQVASRKNGHGGSELPLQRERQLAGVEADGGINVLHDVSYVHHWYLRRREVI